MDEKLKTELKSEIESVVTSIFSEKEEADIRRKTESALQESAEKVQDLTTCLEERNEEISTLTETVTEREEKIQNLESELEAAKKEVEESNDKLTGAENALEEMKKDRAAELRMTELVEAKVVDSDKEAQLVKVREMADEEFATYRDERIALRQAVIDELAAAREEEGSDEGAEGSPKEGSEEGADEGSDEGSEDGSEEGSGEGSEEGLEPANIDPGQAVAAALNMEIIPTADMITKYSELGKAMAVRMTKKQEIEV